LLQFHCCCRHWCWCWSEAFYSSSSHFLASK
jgi:hypothetical protein